MARIRAFAALPLAIFAATAPVNAESYAPANQGSFPDRPMVDSSGVLHFLVQGMPYKLPGVVADPPVSNTPPAASAVPTAPGSLTATVSGTTITVGWGLVTANPPVTSYLVFKNGSNSPAATLSATTNSYADTGQAAGTTDSYAIFAINSIGNSPYMGSISATVPAASTTPPPATSGVPAAPGNLTASATNNSITVGWTLAPANPAITSVLVYKDGSNTALATLAGTATTYTDSSLESGTNHSYAVFAVNSKGSSPYTGSTAATVPAASTYAAQYPGLLGANGGAATPTSLPARHAGFQYAVYGNGGWFNSFTGQAAGAATLSVHSGHASLSDWQGGVGYWLGGGKVQGDFGVTGYSGPKFLSLPLVYHGPNGAPGELLASAAAGNFDAQYQSFGAQIMAAVDVNQPINGQVNIYVRMGEEFNAPSGASNDWAPTSGNESSFVGAYRHAVTNLRAAEAAYTPIAGHTKPHMIYVWCFNLTGSDPRPSFPGSNYANVIGNDLYLFTVYGDPTDADAAFANFKSTKEWGLDFTAALGAQYGLPIAFPEVGVNQDNFGSFYKSLDAWSQTNNVAYTTFWDNNGDYPSQFDNGVYPETGAMIRHLVNPAAFPVEPMAAPMGVSSSVADGSITVSSPTLPMSANATTYSLFEGTAAGQEDLLHPVATSASPSFTLASADGVPKFFRESGGNSLSNGFLSAEITATATPPASNRPAHYLAFGISGYAATPITAAMIPNAQDWDIKFSHCITNLADAKKPDGSSAQLAGMWSGSGYNESNLFALNSGNLLAVNHDNNGRTAGFYEAVSYVLNGCYLDEVQYSSASNVTTFYHDLLGAGTRTPVTSGIGSFGPANTQAGTPNTDPNSHVAPDLRMGQDSGGTSQYTGLWSEMIYTVGTTVVLHPIMNADGTIHDSGSAGAIWTISGGAVPH